jgi:hypothetical protein
MALGSAQPLTKMSTWNLPGGKGRPARKADNLTAICEPRRLTTLLASTACYRDSCSFALMKLIEITLGLSRAGRVRVPVEARFFYYLRRPDRLWSPTSLLFKEYLGLKRPGHESDHLPLVPRSRICGSIHQLPHMSLWHNTELVKHRDNFTFPFTKVWGMSPEL